MILSVKICFNSGSREYFKKLPWAFQVFICVQQQEIEKKVLQVFPDAVATSGYRDPIYNTRIGGARWSYHLWGCARDYRLAPRFPLQIDGLKIIHESDHFHVQVIK